MHYRITEMDGQNEYHKTKLARLAAASALDTAKVPALQFDEIQASGVTPARWFVSYVCTETRSMLILLATVLLVHFARRDCRISSRLLL
jgi:hypothetical protein